MSDILFALVVFIISCGISYLLILKVPQMLHTPLMAMTNAISALVILAALALLAVERGWVQPSLATVALVASAFNVSGGFCITGRMLRMFKSESEKEAARE